MTRTRTAVLLLALIAILGACGTDDQPATNGDAGAGSTRRGAAAVAPKTWDLTLEDSKHHVFAKVGDHIRIRLEQCGGCGYVWREAEDPADPKILVRSPRDEAITTTTTSKQPVVGASTTIVIAYDVIGAGQTQAGWYYDPPGDEGGTDTFELRVDSVLTTATGPRTYRLDREDDGLKLTIAKGDRVLVEVTTGIEPGGHRLGVPPKPEVLRQDKNVEASTTTTTQEEGLVGAGPTRLYGWDAVGVGSTKISFESTEDDPDDPATKWALEFSFDITVADRL